MVDSLAADQILMVPDRNLARNTAAQTDKRVHLWEGCCPFHDILTPEMVRSMASRPIVFAMANPDPEITPEEAHALAQLGGLEALCFGSSLILRTPGTYYALRAGYLPRPQGDFCYRLKAGIRQQGHSNAQAELPCEPHR